MGGVRNGKNAGAPEPAAVRQEALQPGASSGKAEVETSEVVDGHFRAAARLLREGSAARAFGELARASRSLSMTPRLAAGIVRMSLLAGTEAAAIILLEAAPTTAFSRRAVQRQLARVLRRVDQLPRAIAALEALLLEWPEDRRAHRVLQVLRARVSGERGAAPGDSGTAAQGVLAKLPARKDGVPEGASWEYDDGVYLIETVIGPPLAAGTPAGAQGSVTVGAATRAEPSVVVAGAPQVGSRTSDAELPALGTAVGDATAPVDAPRKSATELPAVSTSRVDGTAPVDAPRKSSTELPAVSTARVDAPPGVPRTSATELPAVSTAPGDATAPVDAPRKSATELPAVSTAPGDATAPVDAPRKSATELPAVELPPVVVDAPPGVPRKSATELPAVELPPVVAAAPPDVPRKSATESPLVGTSPSVAGVRPRGPRESGTELPAAKLASIASDGPTGAPPVASGSRPRVEVPAGAAPELGGARAQVPTPDRAPPSTPLEPHKTVLEMSAVQAPVAEAARTHVELPAVQVPVAEAARTQVELPAVQPPVADAPKTQVEMPAISLPPHALGFEGRKTEVELPALGADALVPRTESAREFAPKLEALSVPWADGPDEDDRAASLRSSRPAATWRDDSASDEVTSEAQPFHLGEVAAPVPSRAAAPAKVERRKTPAPSESLPAVAPKVAPGVDSRSGTMEVSLAELEAVLSGAAAAPASVAPSEARPAAHDDDGAELTRSQKMEAQLIARRAWAELAQLYLKRADQAKDATRRAEALTRLAEVMENELHDPAGAARMYREIVDLTGDRAALRDQVRLLAARGDASLVRRALDEAIRRAPSGRARAGALLTRGERWLHMGELKKARADFEAAESLSPGLLPVLAGLLRCVPDAERAGIAERLRSALAPMARRTPDRVESLRVLAQVAEESLRNPRLAQWAWSEVLAESPDSEQARVQLTALARRLGDTTVLSQLLRAQLVQESRGPAARQARLELVATLEAKGDADAALDELRQAVRYEPGHKDAWLMLVERLLQREHLGEAAWALEHAATATEDEEEREQTWDRLARLWREVLGNPERAQVYARRAEGLRQAREERELPPPEPPRSATPRREPSGPRAPLVPAPPALMQSPANVEHLANEVTSTTDPGAAAAALTPPAPEPRSLASASGNAPAPVPRNPASASGNAPAPAPRNPSSAPGNAPAPAPRNPASASGNAPAPAPRHPASVPGAEAALSSQDSVAEPGSAAAPAPRAPSAGAGRSGASASRDPASAPGSAPAPKPRNPASVRGNKPAPAPRAPADSGDASAAAGFSSEPAPRSPPSTPGNKQAPAPRAPAESGDTVDAAGFPVGPVPRSPPSSPGNKPAPVPRAPAGRSETVDVAAVPAPRNPASVPGNKPAPAPRAPAASGDTSDAAGFSSAPAAPQAPAPARRERASSRAASPGRDAEPAARQDANDRSPQRAGAIDLITGEVVDFGAVPVAETRVISWEAPPGRMDPVRRVVRGARPEGTMAAPAPGRTFIAKPPASPEPPKPAPASGTAEPREPAAPAPAYPPSQDTEPDGFRHIRERPLEAKPYRALAEYFDHRGDPDRASLMREIADALDGLETPAPRGQRPPLTSDERAGLRHPGLRTPSGELLACTGIALCRLFPAEGRAAGSSELLRATAGPAAPAVLDALHTAARMLDVHLPELVLAEDDGPPFTAVHAGHPRLLVGRLLLREPMPAPELRFHAGRALLSLSPDLLALRALKGRQLFRALALLSTVLKDPRASGEEARVVRESLSPKALERAVALLEPGTQNFKASALADAARDSANRAGLVACGSMGPALTVLRARRDNEAELVELLRFAASERYLPLRAPR